MAVAFVQATEVESSGAVASLGATFASATTSGNFLVAMLYLFQASTYTVTDSQSNTYTKDKDGVNANDTVAIWRTFASGATTATITLTNTGGDKTCALAIAEFSGVEGTPTVEGTNSNADTPPGGSTAPSSGSVTPADDGSLFIGNMAHDDGTTTPTTTAPFSTINNSTTARGVNASYYVQPTAGAQAAAWGLAAGRDCISIVAVYKAASGGGGGGGTTTRRFLYRRVGSRGVQYA